MSENWSPDSWRGLPIRQVPGYADEAALAGVEETLRRFPPLVFAGEARRLQDRLAAVAAGKGVLFPGGGLGRGFCQVHPNNHPRHVQRVVEIAGGADLLSGLPG